MRGSISPAVLITATLAAGPAGGYTLAEAFRDALAQDARVAAAQSRVMHARDGLDEAAAGGRPTISATGRLGYARSRNEARTVSVYDGSALSVGLRVSQDLDPFGRLAGRMRTAEARLREAGHAAEGARQEVLAETALSFVEQIFRKRILDRREAFAALLDTLAETAAERVAQGTLDRTELHEILRRSHRARAERVAAGARYRIARGTLARLTGAARDGLAAASLARLAAAAPGRWEDALARLDSAPAVAQARRRLEAAEGELAFRRADRMPTVALEIEAERGDAGGVGTLEVRGGARLAAPLYEGGLRAARLRRARRAVETAERDLAAERHRAGTALRAQWEMIESLGASARDLAAATADARTVLALVESKLATGRATIVRQIEARQAVLGSEFDRLDNRLDLETARIEMLRILAALDGG